jgi:hypothetical protein
VTYTPTDTADYNTASSTARGTVNHKALTVTRITASDKAHVGNATATLNTSSATFVGIVSLDAVTLNTASATGALTDPGVGTGKMVLVSSLTLSGTDAGSCSGSGLTSVVARVSCFVIKAAGPGI